MNTTEIDPGQLYKRYLRTSEEGTIGPLKQMAQFLKSHGFAGSIHMRSKDYQGRHRHTGPKLPPRFRLHLFLITIPNQEKLYRGSRYVDAAIDYAGYNPSVQTGEPFACRSAGHSLFLRGDFNPALQYKVYLPMRGLTMLEYVALF